MQGSFTRAPGYPRGDFGPMAKPAIEATGSALLPELGQYSGAHCCTLNFANFIRSVDRGSWRQLHHYFGAILAAVARPSLPTPTTLKDYTTSTRDKKFSLSASCPRCLVPRASPCSSHVVRDQDINTSDTSIPTLPIPLGPITRTHACQLNHQVSSFLSSCPLYLANGNARTLVHS